jgi:methylenetetrahydrofolate reductase (NADPH)
VLAQYDKLFKKARERVDFLITQVGFDVRKFDELLRFMRRHGIQVPILGNVHILNRAVASVMNRGEVPGCVVTDELYHIYQEESEAPDKGKKAQLTRAAKLIGVLKGIGYDGVHIGGPSLRYEDVAWVIEKSKEFSSNWEEWAREFSSLREGAFIFLRRIRGGA